ncbi:HSP70-domain-containing protein [Rhizopogon salebrosus TDB-379]|nr:HSP70-domain-containing protein [Rhizopogon salebrosus TDB-379]
MITKNAQEISSNSDDGAGGRSNRIIGPFNVVDNGGKPAISVDYETETRQFTPKEISAMVLTKMKETAKAYLGEKVTHTVVAVPAQGERLEMRMSISEVKATVPVTLTWVTPKEISAMVLTKMKETAKAYLGEKVTHTVVAVPAQGERLEMRMSISEVKATVPVTLTWAVRTLTTVSL